MFGVPPWGRGKKKVGKQWPRGKRPLATLICTGQGNIKAYLK
jgi:hypothetical protein